MRSPWTNFPAAGALRRVERPLGLDASQAPRYKPRLYWGIV